MIIGGMLLAPILGLLDVLGHERDMADDGGEADR